jgi:GT2 family glycosyltransferase
LVDNGSEDDISFQVKKKFPKTIVVQSKINTGAAGGRNLGLKKARGEYLLFMDDDAVSDKHLVSELVKVMEQDQKIGIVQPKIYFLERRKVIQGVGHGINLITGRVFGIGVGEKDHGQYDKVLDVPMVGCTWMVKKSVFKKIGNYDEDFFIPYEDSDFSIRATKAGFRVCFVPNALVWHSGHTNSKIPKKLRYFGITSSERAYRVSRNKIIFMKKHAPQINLIIFLVFFLPLYTVIHSLVMILTKRFDILLNYWLGLFSGLKYVLTK